MKYCKVCEKLLTHDEVYMNGDLCDCCVNKEKNGN